MSPFSHDLRAFQSAAARLALRLLAAGALAVVSLTAHADDAFDAFLARTASNKTTITFGANGTPILSSAAPTGTPTVGKMGFTQTGEGVFMESLGKVKAPNGVQLPMSAKLKIGARGVGRILYRFAPYATALAIAGDVAQIFTELGYGQNSEGQVGVVGTVYPQYCVSGDGSTCLNGATLYSTKQGAFDSYPNPYTASNNGRTFSCPRVYGAQVNARAVEIRYGTCTPLEGGGTPPDGALFAYVLGVGTAGAGEVEVISEQAFLDAVAARSGWPSSTAIALQQGLTYPDIRAQAEEDIKAQPSTDTTVKLMDGSTLTVGPLTVGTPKVTTKNYTNSNGDPITEQKTETTKASASGNVITYNTTTVTNNYNSTTNVTETTTEESEEEPTDECKDGVTRISCAEFGDPPEDEIPRSEQSVSFTPEVLFGAGSCPAPVGWTDMLGSHEIDLTSYCDMVSSIVRPIVLLFAALAAIFIVAPFRE